jgi:MFS family permease
VTAPAGPAVSDAYARWENLNAGTAIVVVATILGLSANASRPCIQAVIADLVPRADQVRAFSLNYWAVNIGFALASAGAGLLAERGYLLLFFGNALSVLACALLIYLKVPETRPAAPIEAPARHGRAGRHGMAPVLRDGRFMAAVGLTFLLAMVLMQYTTSLPVSMGLNGFSSVDYGLAISMNGLVVVLATIPLTRAIKRRNPLDVLVVAALLSGWGFGLTALADSVPLYIATVCIWTVGEILNSPTSMAVVAALSPAHARARYQGMHTFAWSAATFAGPLLGGLAIDHLGDDALWYACACWAPSWRSATASCAPGSPRCSTPPDRNPRSRSRPPPSDHRSYFATLTAASEIADSLLITAKSDSRA